MKILVAGASGFIGSHAALHLQSLGHDVIAAARNPAQARKRLSTLDWIGCDFRTDTAEDWAGRLQGVDAVVNCVGILQDGLGDSSRAAHVDGAAALIAGAEQAGVKRLVLISAVGGEAAAGSVYGRDKQAGEDLLRRSKLDWVILRPSLVLARTVYGGTAMIRTLCGLPWITPVVGAGQVFRPIGMEDVCEAIATAVSPGAPSGKSWDIAGPERVSLADLMRGYRRWLGFGDSRIWDVPRWLAMPAVWLGDLMGWLGVRTSMRSTSIQQLDYDVEGDPAGWIADTGARPLGFEAYLAATPATVQDRWHARLGFARPVARVLLGLFWMVSGLIALGPGREAAQDLLRQGGFSAAAASWVLGLTALMDMVLGATMLVKWRVRLVAGLMIAAILGYMAALSLSLPQLWLDPLGPVVKVVPLIGLCLLVAASEDER